MNMVDMKTLLIHRPVSKVQVEKLIACCLTRTAGSLAVLTRLLLWYLALFGCVPLTGARP